MDFEPLPLTRHRMISGGRPPIRVLAWHYGTQVIQKIGIGLSEAWRKVWRRSKRIFKNWWGTFLATAILGLAVSRAARSYPTPVADQTAKAERHAKKEAAAAEIAMLKTQNTNRDYAVQYENAWMGLFLGNLVYTCSNMVGSQPPYTFTVSCFLGVKGSLPTKKLDCTELGCTLSALP